MSKIVTTEEMRAIEQAADAQGHSYAAMMERAGRAVAQCVMDALPPGDPPRVAVLVGPGNNGGDGLVAARILKQEIEGAEVRAFLLSPRDPASDPVFAAAQDAGVGVVRADGGAIQQAVQEMVSAATVVIDALFGTRVRLPIAGDAAEVLQGARQGLARRAASSAGRHVPPYTTPANPPDPDDGPDEPLIVAVDCPSGLDCDTGALDPLALTAHHTVTFAAAKPGLFAFPAAFAVGQLHIGDIGLPAPLPPLDDIKLILVDAAETGQRLPRRLRRSHKGTYGKTMVIGGSPHYFGAPYLAASAAYRVGAGLVTVAAPDSLIPTLAGMLPEATWLPLPHDHGSPNADAAGVLCAELAGYTAALIGPGMDLSTSAVDFLSALLTPGPDDPPDLDLPPLVLDAGALTLLAALGDWPRMLPTFSILTPHPAEFARLTGLTTADVQNDRLGLAQSSAAAWDCIVVLKGAFTVIAAPYGRAAVLPFATSALATAGTGDVLAGTIAGLVGQGLDPFDAAVAGGWLHGMAGTRAAWMLDTEASIVAGDVLDLLPAAYALAEHHRPGPGGG